MKSYDFEAVVRWYPDGNYGIFCVGCLSKDLGLNDENVTPIFAGDEWTYAPVCDKCGTVHEYMNIIKED